MHTPDVTVQIEQLLSQSKQEPDPPAEYVPLLQVSHLPVVLVKPVPAGQVRQSPFLWSQVEHPVQFSHNICPVEYVLPVHSMQLVPTGSWPAGQTVQSPLYALQLMQFVQLSHVVVLPVGE